MARNTQADMVETNVRSHRSMNLSQKVAVKRNVTPVRRSRTKQLKKVES